LKRRNGLLTDVQPVTTLSLPRDLMRCACSTRGDLAARTNRNPDFVVLLGPSESDFFRHSVTTLNR
jgi:hypothetical protein